MLSLINRGLIGAVSLVALAAPASATVVVISFTGSADQNYTQDLATGATTDGGAQTVSGTIRIDTSLLGANGADPDFAYFRDDAQFLSVSVSFAGGIAPTLGGAVYGTDSLAGAFGGYGSIDKTWVAEQSTGADGSTMNVNSAFSFGGDLAGDMLVDGIRLPDFASATGLNFYITDSTSLTDAAGNFSGTGTFSIGMIDSVSVAIEPDAVPEPATWGMMILGFGLVGAVARRRAPAALAA